MLAKIALELVAEWGMCGAIYELAPRIVAMGDGTACLLDNFLYLCGTICNIAPRSLRSLRDFFTKLNQIAMVLTRDCGFRPAI